MMAPEQTFPIDGAGAMVKRENSAIISTSTTTPIIIHTNPDAPRARCLKRGRSENLQNSTNLTSIANDSGLPPSPKSPRLNGCFSPGPAPAPLTGVAAMVNQRRQDRQRNSALAMSGNPGQRVLSSVMMGGGTSMSKTQDVPATTATMIEGISGAENSITIPSSMNFDDMVEKRSASVAPTATANPTAVDTPSTKAIDIEVDSPQTRIDKIGQPQASAEDQISKQPTTFLANLLAQQDQSTCPPRDNGLSMPGQEIAPRSPSQKKHSCPYCETEFTRHHNLKSHLLTHSQEKPYICQNCSMRFRRLHDLKRHMKLHTGERPHICPKCDRKFARGDALARHAKGQGGCAGRRSSMGSFTGEGGDDYFDDSNAGEGEEGPMDGVMYSDGTPNPKENEMTEEEQRRFSLPSIQAQHVSGSGSGDSYAANRSPSTYSPAGPRPGQATGVLHPSIGDRGHAISGTSSNAQNNLARKNTPRTSMSTISTGGASIFSQSITESPKPLSPAGMHSHQLGHESSSFSRQRSPNSTTQFQQHNFSYRQSNRASPPEMSLSSPHQRTPGPKLPLLPGLAPPEQRYSISNHTSGQPSPGTGSQNGPQASRATSPSGIFSAGARTPNDPHRQGSGSADSNTNNLFASGERGIWAYVQSMEDKVRQLHDKVAAMESKEKSAEEKISRLSEEVVSLRSQLNAQRQAQHPPAPGHS